MEAAIVGSDTFGRVQSGIPTHRYGAEAPATAIPRIQVSEGLYANPAMCQRTVQRGPGTYILAGR